MIFYRPATQTDFDDYLKRYDFVLRRMSDSTKVLCTQDIDKATRKHMIESDKSEFEANQACQIYARYSVAKEDFDKGIKVYIQY